MEPCRRPNTIWQCLDRFYWLNSLAAELLIGLRWVSRSDGTNFWMSSDESTFQSNFQWQMGHLPVGLPHRNRNRPLAFPSRSPAKTKLIQTLSYITTDNTGQTTTTTTNESTTDDGQTTNNNRWIIKWINIWANSIDGWNDRRRNNNHSSGRQRRPLQMTRWKTCALLE